MTAHRPRPLRLLTFTTLYPNAAQPTHGVFVENRLRHLLAGGGVQAQVVAPVPYFPFTAPAFGSYARYARVPAQETRHGIAVHHPRYLVVPKFGMSLAPALLYAGAAARVQALGGAAAFDVIDAHYFYPDGVAAMWLARRFKLPLVITARGTDINLLPDHPWPRRMILAAARAAASIIAVSGALKERMVALGVDAGKIRVLRNGVDLAAFHAEDRAGARRRLGFSGPTLVSVGNLIPTKGHDLAVEALAALPDAGLLIVGEGPEEGALRALARRLGVEQRVRFTGRVPHEELGGVYRAADVLVLASVREGWPNVLLESMACGTPVAAAAVGGVPEAVADWAAGELLDERSAAGIARAVRRLLDDPRPPAVTRAYAEKFGWEATTAGQMALLRSILAEQAATPARNHG
jgi:teichuronic acid biosynthesis glycosyltransferase TuaC